MRAPYFAIPLYIIITAPLVLSDASARINRHLDHAAFARVASINSNATKTELDVIAAALPAHVLEPLPVKK